MVNIDLLLVSVLRALVEVAGFFLLGQGLLYVLAGSSREKNAVYQLFRVITNPVVKAVRFITPKQVVDKHGVNFMATICAICKAQFTKVLPYYGFNMRLVGGVHQLVSSAIRLGNEQ